MEITVKVSQDVASSLHERIPPTTHSRELLGSVSALGVSLEPMHPGTMDAALMSYFVVRVPNRDMALRVIEQLQQSKMIEAAYLKPPDEEP